MMRPPYSDRRNRNPADHAAHCEIPAEAERRFEEFYAIWWSVVWSSARQLLPCDDDADDAAQSVFLRVWNNGQTVMWKIADPERYLAMAGRNEALKMLRQQKRSSQLSPGLAKTLEAATTCPLDELIWREQCYLVRAMISQLPTRCRMAMETVYLEEMTHREAAEVLGVTSKAVEKQVARGKRLLNGFSESMMLR